MTRLDFSPLSGDPMCVETIDDWAADMLTQWNKMPIKEVMRTISDMTEEECDAMRVAVAKFVRTWS